MPRRKKGPSRRTLQRAKRTLLDEYGDCKWFGGVGIVPTDGGLGLRLNVDPDVPVADGEIPAKIRSVELEIVPIRGYESR
ncbi:MAG: hypothetical protein KJO31_05845 [Gammaproteobacteria bacterium]|nr:hypothetical protein [Gammaproteobacteria bacterium]